jgi:hypothetical protein
MKVEIWEWRRIAELIVIMTVTSNLLIFRTVLGQKRSKDGTGLGKCVLLGVVLTMEIIGLIFFGLWVVLFLAVVFHGYESKTDGRP